MRVVHGDVGLLDLFSEGNGMKMQTNGNYDLWPVNNWSKVEIILLIC